MSDWIEVGEGKRNHPDPYVGMTPKQRNSAISAMKEMVFQAKLLVARPMSRRAALEGIAATFAFAMLPDWEASAGYCGNATGGGAPGNVCAATPNFFVAPNGSDANSGTSLGSPFATIQKGVNSCAPGQTVQVAAGTYSGDIVVTANGTQAQPIQVCASGAVTIMGPGEVAGSAWSGAIIQPANWSGDDATNPTTSGNQWISWAGLIITATVPVPNQVLAFRCSTGWRLTTCIVQGVGGGANVRGQNVVVNVTTFQNIEGTNAHAYVAAGGDGSTTPKLQGFQCLSSNWNHINTQRLTNSSNSAVHKILGSTGALIQGCTIDTVGGSGVWFDGAGPPSDGMTIAHNKFSNCGDYGVQLEANPNSNSRINNNSFVNCGNTGASGQTGAVGINESQGVQIDHNQFNGGNIQSISTRNGSHPTVVQNINVNNNWFNDSGFAAVIDADCLPSQCAITCDFDTFGPAAGPYLSFAGVNASTLAQCQSSFGQETHGATANSPPAGTGP